MLSNRPKFKCVYWRNNLPKLKDRAYCIALCVAGNDVTYFNGSGVKYILKEIKKLVDNENIIANAYRIQPNFLLRNMKRMVK